jgi:tRNA modification GTPase
MNLTPQANADTIVAPATAPGRGAIGIVRVSGPLTEVIARQLLGSLPAPRYASHARFRDAAGVVIDSGIALYFPEPDSFTGESVLELQGHGGPAVMALLVDAALALGARRARPGEFSERAFLNGKLDLAQAEAIADLIDSATAQAARAAYRSLSGTFSDAVELLASALVRLRLHVEAAIDFPEEEIDFLSDEGLRAQIGACNDAFEKLVAATRAGRLLRDGFQLVIVGKPNAGKSSLLNFLSGEDAAIVTDVAGTTRDILRERIDIDGLAVELVDTAGLRDDPDVIEAEGIRRAREALAQADGVLLIQDACTDSPEERPTDFPENMPMLVIRNKIDLSGDPPGSRDDAPEVIHFSARTGAGNAALREAIVGMAAYQDQGEGAFTARQRHLDALHMARAHFDRGRHALEQSGAGELLAEELRLAHDALAAITGAFSSDELLGMIFSEFCIGK